MSHNVGITDFANGDLAAIQPAKIRRQISDRIDDLENNPRPHKAAGCCKGMWNATAFVRGNIGLFTKLTMIH